MNPVSAFDLSRAREIANSGSMRFWSSLDELLDEKGFRAWMAGEFPAAASMFEDPGRRQFLKLMGASLLLGGLTGCGQNPSDQALPYVNQPENTLPGVPRYYATAVLLEGYAQPVIATTYDGRPTKLDGNPDHPATRGKSDAFMQATVLGLYDPERSKMPAHDGNPSTWPAFATALTHYRASWKKSQGEGLRILTGETTSDTLIRQMRELTAQFPKLQWHRYEPVGSGHQTEAMRTALGQPAKPHYDLERCDVVVTIGDDLLGPGPHQVMHAAAWSKRRGEVSPKDGRQRMHVAECVPGLSGVVATTRLACDASRLALLVQGFAASFGLPGWQAAPLEPNEQHWLDQAAADLQANEGKSLLTVGTQLDPVSQAAAVAINARLKNNGVTVSYSEPIVSPIGKSETLETLTADIASGLVDTLIIADCNPAYATSGAVKFSELLSGVPNRIHAGLHFDETAKLCQWHLPLSHPLEIWGDACAVDGTVTIIQPVIAPLYASRSLHQIADLLLGVDDPAGDDAVRRTWQQTFGKDFDTRWTQALHDGFVADTAAKLLTLAAKAPMPPDSTSIMNEGDLDIVFLPDPSIWDGRFGNIAWLQELPKPLTKITWDNVIAISPAIAAAWKLTNSDLAEVIIDDRKIKGAVWIVPGQAPHTIALTLGYGRRAGGEIAQQAGYDAFAAMPADHTFARGSITRVDGAYPIATTQAHHRMDGFDFVREVTSKTPRTPAAKETPSLYPEWDDADHAWGMVIDLDRCIGCNACVSACNVENNVLVVGKDQVSRGREMSWLRIDRYYTGDVENPRSYFQPVPCMHCEKAPCEMGCPVHATTHSSEGINQQIYNRCIGTRTCSSYCPYKVRRFNWYDYRKLSEAERGAKNPDVTVRSRGVMEKCTYCTQRIEAAHVLADKENRPLRRDEVTTACQQACPTQAITFGDLKDKDSAVAKQRSSGRHYTLLEELGTRPRTTYLARWNDTPEDGEG